MKHFLHAIVLLLLPASLLAQAPLKQGVIRYKQVLKLPKRVALKNPVLAAIMKDGMHVQLKVTFQEGKFALEDGAEAQVGKLEVNLAEERELINLDTKTSRTETTIAGTTYYTEAAEKGKAVVRYYKGTRQIAGYTCYRAFVRTDSTVYMVWYTPAIPFAYNPLGLKLATLNGAVLGYQTDGSTCMAVSVSTTDFSPAALVPNKAALKTTPEEVSRLYAQQMKALSGKHKVFEVK